MRFSWELEIAQPLERVLEVLEDPYHPLAWQPGLVSITPLEGSLGAEGSVASYQYDLDGQYFELRETIVVNQTPAEHTARYEGRGMVHTVTNRFEPADVGTTRLVSRHQGYFTGVVRLLSPLLRRPMRERWRVELARFRTYVETGER